MERKGETQYEPISLENIFLKPGPRNVKLIDMDLPENPQELNYEWVYFIKAILTWSKCFSGSDENDGM